MTSKSKWDILNITLSDLTNMAEIETILIYTFQKSYTDLGNGILGMGKNYYKFIKSSKSGDLKTVFTYKSNRLFTFEIFTFYNLQVKIIGIKNILNSLNIDVTRIIDFISYVQMCSGINSPDLVYKILKKINVKSFIHLKKSNIRSNIFYNNQFVIIYEKPVNIIFTNTQNLSMSIQSSVSGKYEDILCEIKKKNILTFHNIVQLFNHLGIQQSKMEKVLYELI